MTTQTKIKKQHIKTSQWWRFNEYEIIGGTHITPAKNSKVHLYNPIEHSKQAHLELNALDLNDTEAIINWCNQFGLLGIMPYRTTEVHLPPSKGHQDSYKSHLPNQYQRSKTLYPVSSHIKTIAQENPIQSDLYNALGRFFPDINECGYLDEKYGKDLINQELIAVTGNDKKVIQSFNQRQYPLPGSKDFQNRYAEPLNLFRLYAGQIKQSIDMIEKIKNSNDFNHFSIRNNTSLKRFQNVLSSISPMALFTNTMTSSMGWQFNSLYSALHLMMLFDLTNEDRYFKRCQHNRCGKLFTTNDDRVLYDTPQCQKNAQMKRYRRNKDKVTNTQK